MKENYYTSGEHKCFSKAQAYLKSAETNLPVTWYFADDIWRKTSCNLTVEDTLIPLTEWYKLRALQLREKYEYLILNFSGGMDSWNILYTFLKNNIRLDEIHVKSSATIDEKLSTFSLSKDSKNFHSEWYYTILPDLRWISTYYPSIKITTTDAFAESKIDLSNPEIFANAGHFLGTFELMRQTTASPTVVSNISMNIGEIWGIDKPSFHILENGDLGLFFVDSTVSVPHTPAIGYSTQELFYYSVDMPKLPFIQAINCYRGMKNDIAIDDIFDVQKRKLIPLEVRGELWTQVKRDIAKKYLYSESINFRPRILQVDKPTQFSESSRSRDYYYDTHSETEELRKKWKLGWTEFLSSLKKPLITSASSVFKHHTSNYYRISKDLL